MTSILSSARKSTTRRRRIETAPDPTWHPNRNLSGLQLYLDPIPTKVSTGGSRQYTSSNSEYHSRADNAAFDLGTGDFLFAFYVYRDASSAEAILAKREDVNNRYSIEIDSSDKIDFIAVAGGSTKLRIQGNTALSSSAWHHVIVLCDRSTTAGCKVFLNGTDDTAGTPTTSTDDCSNSGAFEVGRDGNTVYANGRIARVAKGSIADVTAIETSAVSALYSSGNGVTWAELTADQRTNFGFTASNGAFFIGNEASGNLTDSVNSLDLTDNASVTSANGPVAINAQDESTNNNHGVLTSFSDPILPWKTDVSSAINTGFSLQFDGSNDVLIVGATGLSVTYVEFYVKFLADNQEIFTLQNSTATAVTVSGGTLTFGGSLTASSITVDGISKTAGQAGTLLNDNSWHKVSFSLSSISASDFRMGTDGSGFGNILLDEFKLNTSPDGHWKFDDGPQSQGVADGDPIQTYEDSSTNRKIFLNSVRAEQPQFSPSVAVLNNRDALLFSGGQLLQLAESYLTGSEGLFACVFRLTDLSDTNQRLFSSSDTATADSRMSFTGYRTSGDPDIRIRHESSNTVNYDIRTNTTDILVNTNYLLIISSNDSLIKVELNGAAQSIVTTSGTNGGQWFGESAARDNCLIGALRHTGDGNHMTGYIARMLVANQENSDQIVNLRKTWARHYGIAI